MKRVYDIKKRMEPILVLNTTIIPRLFFKPNQMARQLLGGGTKSHVRHTRCRHGMATTDSSCGRLVKKN